jgi:hypothetical protein
VWGPFPYVTSLATHGDDLIAGGQFATAGGAPASNIARWDGSGWSALGAGTDGQVLALASQGGQLIAGGTFT